MKELFQLTTVPSSGASSGSGSSGESNKSEQDTGSPKVQVLKSKNWKNNIPNSVPFWLTIKIFGNEFDQFHPRILFQVQNI